MGLYWALTGKLFPTGQGTHWEIVSNHIMNSIPRVELDSKATRVSQSLRRAPLVDDRGEAYNHRRLHPRRTQKVCTGQVRDVMGDLRSSTPLT